MKMHLLGLKNAEPTAGPDTRPASSMVTGTGCRGENPSLRRREKNVLDIPYVAGQLERSKKPQQVRGLNRNYNHDLKNLFKSAATNAVAKSGPLQEFYLALVKRGIRPEMARLTVARKIAAITLAIWKKGVSFDAENLKQQTA